jgi:hypothetical protein
MLHAADYMFLHLDLSLMAKWRTPPRSMNPHCKKQMLQRASLEIFYIRLSSSNIFQKRSKFLRLVWSPPALAYTHSETTDLIKDYTSHPSGLCSPDSPYNQLYLMTMRLLNPNKNPRWAHGLHTPMRYSDIGY